jgi:Icc-related predicted phosphoesterase
MADDTTLRLAAAGDLHVSDATQGVVAAAFAAIDGDADLILLAGDLTTHGEPEQAALLAEACKSLETPVVAVLGNHDLHADRVPELTAALEEGGIEVLTRSHTTRVIDGAEVGIVGAKGFVGGFADSTLPDFGEPSLRAIYAETGAEAEALEIGLHAIETCPFRIVLLHYAPTAGTLVGEPEPIWTYLGSERLADPIRAHAPDLVLHGHAHSGTFQSDIAGTPVHNVSVPVMKRDFWVFELSRPAHERTVIH